MKHEQQEQFLLSLLHEYDWLSSTEAMEQLQVKRRSLFNILNRLRDKGHVIKQSRGKLHLVSEADSYSEINKNIIRYWWILRILQENGNPMTVEEMISAYPSTLDGPVWCMDSLKTVIKEMCDYSLLKEQSDKTYWLFHAPAQIVLTDNIAEELLLNIRNFKSGTPYADTLDQLYIKIMDTCPDILILEEENKYYTQTRASSLSEAKIKSFQDFVCYPYDRYALDITYLSKKNEKILYTIKVGLLIYSEEKDRFYILGSTNEDTILLNMERICDISSTSIPNDLFRCKSYLDMAEEMFDACADPLVHVKVHFDNVYNISEKLQRLCKLRKHATLTRISEQTLLFEDDVRGLNDFANYLRRFGRSVTVIEPPELQEKIHFSVIRALERYRQLQKGDSHE